MILARLRLFQLEKRIERQLSSGNCSCACSLDLLQLHFGDVNYLYPPSGRLSSGNLLCNSTQAKLLNLVLKAFADL